MSIIPSAAQLIPLRAPSIVAQTPVVTDSKQLTVSTVRVKRGYYDTVIFDDSADKSAAGKVLPSHEHEGRTFGPYVIDRMNHRTATRDEAMEQHREALYAARTEQPQAVTS